VTVFAISLFIFSDEGWRNVISFRAFSLRELEFAPNLMSLRKQHIKILFYEDGPDATVSVERMMVFGSSSERVLRINGKPDASTTETSAPQLLLAHRRCWPGLGKGCFLFSASARASRPGRCSLTPLNNNGGGKLRAGHQRLPVVRQLESQCARRCASAIFGTRTPAQYSSSIPGFTM